MISSQPHSHTATGRDVSQRHFNKDVHEVKSSESDFLIRLSVLFFTNLNLSAAFVTQHTLLAMGRQGKKAFWTEVGRAESFTKEWPFGQESTCSPAEVHTLSSLSPFVFNSFTSTLARLSVSHFWRAFF